MKKMLVSGVVFLCVSGRLCAQTVFTNGIDVAGQHVQGVGLIDLTNTNLPISTMAPSVGQLAGIDPQTGATITNGAYLFPLRPAWLETDAIYAHSSNGLTLYDSANNAVLIIQQGAISGNGTGLTGITAAQVGAISTNHVLISSNDTAVGQGANGSTSGAALGNWANAGNYGTAVGRIANGSGYGVALGLYASGTNYGVAVGKDSLGSVYGIAVGTYAIGNNYGVAVGKDANGSFSGTALGSYANGTNSGVAIGFTAVGAGRGNIALGGDSSWTKPAVVPNGWTDTAEIGRGTATLQGGLNFRGYGIVDSNGVVVAPISTTNLTVQGVISGNGSGLTNLSASQLVTGQLPVSVLPTNGSWNAGGLVLTNVVVQGLTASQISGLGSAALSNATAFAVADHQHDASYDALGAANTVSNVLNATIQGLATNKADSSNVWTRAEADGRYVGLAGGTVTNLNVTGTATLGAGSVSNLTVTGGITLTNAVSTNRIYGVTLISTKGDLGMGSYTNQPGP